MRALGLVLLLALVLVAILLVVGWRLSDRILVPSPYGLQPEFEIVDARPAAAGVPNVAPDRPADVEVLLPPQPPDPPQFARTEAEGRYGLLWEGGAGRLGPVGGREADAIVRPLAVTRGRPPRAGDAARLDVVLFHGDPSERGLVHRNVRIPGPLGPLPGWWLPGAEEDAILVLHGRRRADRTETLRMLPTLAATGASVLVSSYRNHDASPDSPDGFFHYGATEVRDARAALDWLAARGVRRVVLVGISMGGAVSIQALAEDAAAPTPIALVLDSPLLDPATAFARVARRSGVPGAGPLSRLATAVAGVRAGIDWERLDARRIAPRIDVPVLLIGGTADDTVPIELLDAFARRLPEPPTYLRLDGVQHVEGWNADPARYEDALASFLAGLDLAPP